MPGMVKESDWNGCEYNYDVLYSYAAEDPQYTSTSLVIAAWHRMELLNASYVEFYVANPQQLAAFDVEAQQSFLRYCILYAPFNSVTAFIEAAHKDVLTGTYGQKNEPLIDYCYGLLEDLKATQLSDAPTLREQKEKYQKIVDYLIQEKGLRISAATMATQEVESLNPQESVENKAVLVSVQHSIEKLLDKYGYLKPGAISPVRTSAYHALQSFIQQLRPSSPKLKDAIVSFKAAMNAKIDAKKYNKRSREELYGMYRFTVSNMTPTKTFTMPELFVVFWQALNDVREIPLEDREDFLNRWIEAMYEAGNSQDAEHNSVIDFEGSTAGCSNAMINMSVGVLASQHSCVKVNYANTKTMELKAFHDFFSTWVIEALAAKKQIVQPILEEWIKNPLNGMPDALYALPGLQETLKKQLEEEYAGVMPAADLEREIATVIELLPLRGDIPPRVKHQLLQDSVEQFVVSQHLSAAALQDARIESEKPKTSVTKVWGLKSTDWKTFFKNTLNRLLPTTLSPEVRQSYEKIELEVVKAYLHAPAKSKVIEQGVSHSRHPTGKHLPPLTVPKK